jgi:RimJ/RimL family protein N-acetyltransferase
VEIVTRGRIHLVDQLPGFIAFLNDQRSGLVTYHIEADACEIVSLNSMVEGAGIGTAMLKAVDQVARASGCRRIWLITTNDNLHALRFYQKRGFALAAIHRRAIEATRRIKPTIPLIGLDGIPIRDEIELEYLLHANEPHEVQPSS